MTASLEITDLGGEDRLLTPYRCPRTGHALAWSTGEVVARDPGPRYAIQNGVARFHATPYRDDGNGAVRARRALELTGSVGWREALVEAYGAGSPEVAYVTDERFSAIDAVLEIDRSTRVLEIGCSMGQHTVSLARAAASVHAMDINPDLAAFALARCREEGLDNVSAASGGDDARLPFAPESFDLVVLNLVLEWCGGASTEPHEVVQARLLQEIARVLAPGGRAFVSTKNRFALQHLAGQRDIHVGNLPFGSVLPRKIAAKLLAKRGVARPAGQLHSYDALSNMLRHAGFSNVEGYWATPEMRRPKELVPVEAASIKWARARADFVHGSTRLDALVLSRVPAALVRHVTPGLTFVATK